MGTALRVGWIPFVLCVVATFLIGVVVVTLVSGGMEIPTNEDGAVESPWLDIAAQVVFAFIFASFCVAIVRVAALGEQPASGAFYFRFGPREWVAGLASIFYGLFATVISAAVVFALELVGIPVNDPLPWFFSGLEGDTVFKKGIEEALPLGDATLPILIFSMVAMVLFTVWLSIRWITLLPVVAVEGRFSLGRAMALTRGNFWRILAALLLYSLVIVAVYGSVFGLAFLAFMSFGTVSALIDSVLAWVALAPVLLVLVIVLVLFLAGSSTAFYGIIYKHLAEPAEA